MSIKSLIQCILLYLLKKTGVDLNPKGELRIMYIVKDDNPDVSFTLSFDTFDAEGHAVDESGLQVTVESDNEDVVAVTYDSTAGTGNVSFGAPGTANLNATVMNGETMLGSFGAQFTVTTGDPASISGGTIAFDGLSES